MQTVAAYRIDFQPYPGQSPRAGVEGICADFSDFVVKYYRGRKRELLPLTFDGRCERPEQGNHLITARYVCAQHTLATLDWEIVPTEDPRYVWRVSCACAADCHGIEVQYEAQIGLRTLLISAGKFQMNIHPGLLMPVDLLHSLLANRTATIDGWRVPVSVQILQANDVEGFVEQILLNSKRSLPVILLAADGRFKATPSAMQELQCCLLGAAHVAAVMNPAATERLTALLGPERACAEGVFRIYYPLFTRDSPPEQHPLFHKKNLPAKSKLELVMQQLVMKHFMRRILDGPVTVAARAAVCAELSKHSAHASTLMMRLSSAQDKLRSTEAQRDRFQADRDEARQSLRSLQGKLTEQMRTASNQADALQAMTTNLDTRDQELASLRAEHNLTLEQLHECEQKLAETQHNLQLVRVSLDPPPLPSHRARGEAEEEIQRAWQESDQTLSELESARQELAALRTELAICKENLDTISANPGSKRIIPDGGPLRAPIFKPPTTVAEALQFMSEHHAEALDVWDDAWSSAKKSHFPGPTRVLQALQTIVEVGRLHFAALQKGEALGPLDQAFRVRIPFKYAPCESQMTMAMHGHERVFQGPNQRREIQRHLTLGGGGNCLQIYFEFDEARQKVIIAHCGQHLSHYRQS